MRSAAQAVPEEQILRVETCNTINVYKAVNSILASLANYKDIQIVFGGVPSTNGKTVYLGEPPTHSQDALDAYLAHGTHEIHHVLFTDFTNVSKLGGLHLLVNALEDVRIDAIGYRKTPGTYFWRETYLERMLKRGRLPEVNEKTSPAKLLCLSLYWHMTDKTLGYSFTHMLSQSSQNEFIRRFGEDLYEELSALAYSAVTSESTDEVIAYAKLIAERFIKELSLGKNRRKTSGNSVKKQAEQEAVPAKNTSSNSTGSDAAADRKLEQKFTELFEGENPDQFDIHKLLEQESRSKGKSPDLAQGSNSIWPAVRSELTQSIDEHFVQDLEQYEITASARFRKFLNSNVMRPRHLSRRSKQLSTPALAGLMVGEDRIFTTEDTVKQPSAAFAVLIDRSGSMDKRTMRTAAICGAVLCRLIDRVSGCRASAYAFPGMERNTLLEIKRFDERSESVTDRFAGIRSFGYTPVCQSLNSAAAILSNRKERRKIIFMLTDGLCSEEELLKERSKVLTNAGIEVVCLGIGRLSPLIFDLQKNIEDAFDMQEALYELLEATMKKHAD